MSTIYITEFGLGSKHREFTAMPPLAEQTVAIGGASAASAAFIGDIIRVCADAACSIVIGPAPVATATKLRIPANVPEYFVVSPGDKLAVITNA